MADSGLLGLQGRLFRDPAEVLRRLRLVEVEISNSETPDRVKRLRTGPLRAEREMRDAALFAHGMSAVLGTKVFFSPGETSDADFATLIAIGDRQIITLVQLKELVPADLNPRADLTTLMKSLHKRPPSDTVLAVLLNQRGKVDLASLTSCRVPFAELWFYWAASPDQSEWR